MTTAASQSSRPSRPFLQCLLGAIICFSSYQSIAARAVLRWSDEFRVCPTQNATCVSGGINTRKWGFELGDGTSYGPSLIGWGNWQRQCHTNASSNAFVEPFPQNPTDGMLVLRAGHHPEGHECYNANAAASVTKYTSARLITRNKAAFRWRGAPGNSTPVRIDIRLQMPLVNGTWPAAWMLPETKEPWCMGCGPYGKGWCLGGEIDIAEHINTRPQIISNVHYGGLANASWLDCHEKVGTFKAGLKVGNWHTMSLVWDSTYIRFLADGELYSELKLGGWWTGGNTTNPYAPFDVPFYLIFDMAVGGLYPGFNIDNGAIAAGQARLNIDYVRVYDILP